jgi:hypothetical protein
MTTVQNLDKRIATALSSTDHEPADLPALITEVEQTAGSVTAEMAFSSKAMLDPLNPDFTTSKDRVDRAKLMLARFDVALPKLKALHAAAVERDRLARWHAEMDRAEAVRDQLARRLRELYPKIVVELVTLFDQIAACDKTIGDLHMRSGVGVPRRLADVELAARGITSFGGSRSIVTEIKLPGWTIGSGVAPPAWPRAAPNYAFAMMPATMTAPLDPEFASEVAAAGGGWHGETIVRNRRRAEEVERTAAAGRERERQREAMKNAEAEEQRRQRV